MVVWDNIYQIDYLVLYGQIFTKLLNQFDVYSIESVANLALKLWGGAARCQ